MKGSGFVFGAYTHCAWPAVDAVVADPTGKSFVFSLVNKAGKAVRFSLQDKNRAIEAHDGGGLLFGATETVDDQQTGWANFVTMNDGLAADERDANCANSIDDTEVYHPDDAALKCDETFLAGEHYFAAEEIEVYQL